jgi:nucleoside-diphosphate-sugar epimerase
MAAQQPDTVMGLARGWLAEGAALRLQPPRWAAMLAMRFLWQRPHRLDNRLLRARLGSEPHTPLAQAAAAAVDAPHRRG